MATATKAINLRVDADLKAQAESIFAELGLPTSTAITMFLKSVVRCGGIPLDLHVAEDPFYSEENQARLKKSIKQMESGHYVTKTMDELERLANE